MSVSIGYRACWTGRRVTVSIHDPGLTTALAGFYPRCRCAPQGGGGPRIVVRRNDDGVYQMTAPSGVWRAHERGEMVALFEAELTDAMCEGSERYVRLHGSAVDVGRRPTGAAGRCVLLFGGSGAGKSSLALGLGTAGGRPVTDDLVLLDASGGHLEPFDRSIRVHRDALSALGIRASEVPGARYIEPYLWVEPGTLGRPEPRASPGLIAFLEPGRPLRAERLSVRDTLRRLLVARYGPGEPRRDFEALRRLAGATPAYRLAYDRLDRALDRLAGLSGLPTPRALAGRAS